MIRQIGERKMTVTEDVYDKEDVIEGKYHRPLAMQEIHMCIVNDNSRWCLRIDTVGCASPSLCVLFSYFHHFCLQRFDRLLVKRCSLSLLKSQTLRNVV